MDFLSIGIAVLAAVAGLAAGYTLPSRARGLSFGGDQKRLEEAREQADEIRKEATHSAQESQRRFQEEAASHRERSERMKANVAQKEELLKRRETRNKNQENAVRSLKGEIKALGRRREEASQSMLDELSTKTKLSREQALEEARTSLTTVMSENKDKRHQAELEEFEDEIQRHAKAVLRVAIQRLGVPSSVDKNSTTVTVRDDAFKGMLAGKNGVNVTYLESLLPVSILFNHGGPKNIHVGGVNLLRRNIAKRAINKMQKRVRKKGRITHKMIDDTVAEAEAEIMKECDDKGRWAFKQMGLNPKNVDPEIVNYVGRLYFRTSYGQNIIHHSLEMAYAARLIAELIGTDVQVAMQAAFYHDLGKAIDHDVGGAHDDLSKEILEKHEFDPRIVHAAYAHHDKVPCEAPADFIVKAVDSISGGRPGARMESVTNYFERMKQLEQCAKAFGGVNKVFTMSAGREVRVMVNRDQIKDGGMQELADKVANKISEDVSFPGIIKVNLIRTTRSVDYAKDKKRRHAV